MLRILCFILVECGIIITNTCLRTAVQHVVRRCVYNLKKCRTLKTISVQQRQICFMLHVNEKFSSEISLLRFGTNFPLTSENNSFWNDPLKDADVA